VDTIECFLKLQGKTAGDVEPLSLEFYLSYVEWFQRQKEIHPLPVYIERLDTGACTGGSSLSGNDYRWRGYQGASRCARAWFQTFRART